MASISEECRGGILIITLTIEKGIQRRRQKLLKKNELNTEQQVYTEAETHLPQNGRMYDYKHFQ